MDADRPLVRAGGGGATSEVCWEPPPRTFRVASRAAVPERGRLARRRGRLAARGAVCVRAPARSAPSAFGLAGSSRSIGQPWRRLAAIVAFRPIVEENHLHSLRDSWPPTWLRLGTERSVKPLGAWGWQPCPRAHGRGIHAAKLATHTAALGDLSSRKCVDPPSRKLGCPLLAPGRWKKLSAPSHHVQPQLHDSLHPVVVARGAVERVLSYTEDAEPRRELDRATEPA